MKIRGLIKKWIGSTNVRGPFNVYIPTDIEKFP